MNKTKFYTFQSNTITFNINTKFGLHKTNGVKFNGSVNLIDQLQVYWSKKCNPPQVFIINDW